MRKVFMCLIIGIVFFTNNGCGGTKKTSQDEAFSRIENVKLGMKKEEVLEIMKGLKYATSESIDSRDGKMKINIVFPIDNPVLSTVPSCSIDKEKNRVEEIVYNEDDYITDWGAKGKYFKPRD